MEMTDQDIVREILPVFFDKARAQVLEANRTLMLLEQPELPEAIRAESLDSLLRLLHTIKGDAGAVGMGKISLIAHEIESSLKEHRAGDGLPRGGEVFSAWFKALDILAAMAESENDEIDGERLVDIKELLESHKPASPARDKKTRKKKAEAPEPEPEPPAPPPSPAPAPAAAEQASPVRAGGSEEVVRVTTKKLDKLAEGMSELIAMRLHQEMRARSLHDRVQSLIAGQEGHRKDLKAFASALDKSYHGGELSREAHAWLISWMRDEEKKAASLRRSMQETSAETQKLFKETRQAGAAMRSQEEELRGLRMTPVADLFSSFHRYMRDAARELGKSVEFTSSGESVELDRKIIEQLRDPLVHLLRNSLDHGLEDPATRRALGKPASGRISLRAFTGGVGVVIEVEDDGRGFDLAAIRQTALARGVITGQEAESMSDRRIESLVFDSGFSTKSEVTLMSGRGVGMDAVRTWVEGMRGRLEWESRPGQGLLIRMTLPLTMATIQALMVKVANHNYALPIAAVERVRRVKHNEVKTVEGKPCILHDGQPVELILLGSLLGVTHDETEEREEFPVVLSWGSRGILGLVVDGLKGEQEIVLKSFTRYLKRVPFVAGAAIVSGGEVVVALNASDIHIGAAKMRERVTAGSRDFVDGRKRRTKKRVLVADDSLITRTMESRILVKAGYEVIEAGNGAEAYEALKGGEVDLLVTDVQMPKVSGLELTKMVRGNARFAELPIIIVSFLGGDEDRMNGMEAGASAYLTKSQFSQASFLGLVRQMIGD